MKCCHASCCAGSGSRRMWPMRCGSWPRALPIISRARCCTWTADLRWSNEMTTNNNITKEEIEAIFPRVAEIMADALGCDVEQVKLEASLIDDLGAESIDFLD